MLQREFNEYFVSAVLDYLWGRWRQLGIDGFLKSKQHAFVDPEALLVLTFDFGRYDARLFDEMLGWLESNGHWINVTRLRNVIGVSGGATTRRVAAAVAGILGREKNLLKWRGLSKLEKTAKSSDEAFFLKPDGTALPIGPNMERDPEFLKQYFVRAAFSPRGIEHPPPTAFWPHLLFKLRGIVGLNARAEILAHLILKRESTQVLIAETAHYSLNTVQPALKDMVDARILQLHKRGRTKLYSLAARSAWLELLGLGMDDMPVGWGPGAGLSALMIAINDYICDTAQTVSPYMLSSRLRALFPDLRDSFLDTPAGHIFRDERDFPGEEFTKTFLQDLTTALRTI